MASDRAIVVTGIGVVSPIGIGKGPFWTALGEGRSGIRRLDMAVDPAAPPAIGGQVADFDPKQYVRPRKSLKVMSRDVQLAFAAADLALADAGLREKPVDPERLGVVFGAGVIPCELDELAGICRSSAVDGRVDLRRWGRAAASELFPLWMLKYLPNMPACHIAIGQDARGPSNTITLDDVSSLLALGEARRILERGQADALITGGVGARLHPLEWARRRIMPFSRRGDAPEAASRPFDARRDGVVNGEGAAAVILEPLDRAQARGAVPLARVLGYAGAFEPHRSRCLAADGTSALDRSGTAIRNVILAALRDAGLAPADVGLVIAHGVSTPDDDRLEAQAIRQTLGDVPVTAPKSYYGHLGTAAGALETVVAVSGVAARSDPAHPELRVPRSGVPRQRDSRPAGAVGQAGGADPQPQRVWPGRGDAAGGRRGWLPSEKP